MYINLFNVYEKGKNGNCLLFKKSILLQFQATNYTSIAFRLTTPLRGHNSAIGLLSDNAAC
jgi:hypothetical protein